MTKARRARPDPMPAREAVKAANRPPTHAWNDPGMTTPSAQYSLTLRVELPHRGGALSKVTSAIANAGGVINVYSELAGWDLERAFKKADEIFDTILDVFELAKTEGIPTYRAADRLAERRLGDPKASRKSWSDFPPRDGTGA